MLKKSIFLLLSLYVITLSAQKRELSTDYYGNGKIHWKGYEESWTDSLKDKGLVYWRPVGLWTYWHFSGPKMLEIFHNNAKGERYINMWLSNNQQILTDGNGTYYKIEKNDEEGGLDSLVYEVKDSVKNGKFSRYHMYNSKTHVLISTGNYLNEKKSGVWTFRDSVLQKSWQTTYTNDKENGPYTAYYMNGKTKEEGIKSDDEEEGLWKYYDANGKLQKEINYKNGIMFGKYTEYHPNGNVKESGQYSWTKGYTTESVFDMDGNEKKVKKMSDRVPKKSGEWKTFDESGKLLTTKNLSAAAGK